MTRLACLTPRQRALLREADVPVLLPYPRDSERIEANAQTTTRDGLMKLVALSARAGSDPQADALEVLTIAREALMASLPSAERGAAADEVFMREYLEREAVSALALRTLELAEGAAYTLTTPLDQLISARAAELPSPHVVEVRVDDGTTRASRIAFAGHAATWADLPTQRAGFIAYGSSRTDVLELTTCRV